MTRIDDAKKVAELRWIHRVLRDRGHRLGIDHSCAAHFVGTLADEIEAADKQVIVLDLAEMVASGEAESVGQVAQWLAALAATDCNFGRRESARAEVVRWIADQLEQLAPTRPPEPKGRRRPR